MSRPRTEDPEIRRIKILDAARLVLVTKGFQDFRMSDVAKKADIAAGTLYLYFKNKLDIYVGVFMDLMDRLDKRFEATAKGLTGVSALSRIAREMLAFIDEYQDFLNQYTGEHPGLMRSKLGDRLKARFICHMELISRFVKEAIRAKDLRPQDPLLATLHFVWLGRMFMVNKIISQSKKPLKSRADDLMALFLYGVGASLK